MPNWVANLSGVSLGSICKGISRPGMIPVRLLTPGVQCPSDAAAAMLPALHTEQAGEFRSELLGNHEFFDALNRSLFAVRGRRLDWYDWNEFIYIVVRAVRPARMIETGVFDGQSSAVILEAMRQNEVGELISIDMPALGVIEESTSCMINKSLPPGRQPGWIIPDHLRVRHRLELGDSRVLLPQVLKEFPEIDIFMHDSLHTFEHMQFEYRVAWPKIRLGGCLLSDDVKWNPAFHRFCAAQRRPYVLVEGFGGICK